MNLGESCITSVCAFLRCAQNDSRACLRVYHQSIIASCCFLARRPRNSMPILRVTSVSRLCVVGFLSASPRFSAALTVCTKSSFRGTPSCKHKQCVSMCRTLSVPLCDVLARATELSVIYWTLTVIRQCASCDCRPNPAAPLCTRV